MLVFYSVLIPVLSSPRRHNSPKFHVLHLPTLFAGNLPCFGKQIPSSRIFPLSSHQSSSSSYLSVVSASLSRLYYALL
ncbi:hypothetical protein HanIR_Chr10g0495011 [Helianthus annuus]|nr:hypothetical protein HanIR_Chr10g0495011 [Helianthus annuus]